MENPENNFKIYFFQYLFHESDFSKEERRLIKVLLNDKVYEQSFLNLFSIVNIKVDNEFKKYFTGSSSNIRRRLYFYFKLKDYHVNLYLPVKNYLESNHIQLKRFIDSLIDFLFYLDKNEIENCTIKNIGIIKIDKEKDIVPEQKQYASQIDIQDVDIQDDWKRIFILNNIKYFKFNITHN